MPQVRLECVADPSGLAELRNAWARVWHASADRSPFLTWEWVDTWWRHFGGNDQLEVVVARDHANDVIAIAPLLRARLGFTPLTTTMIVGIGQESADYGGFLLGDRPGETGPLLVNHVLDAVEHGAVSANLTRLRPDGDLLPIVREMTAGRSTRMALVNEEDAVYPYLDLSTVDDPEEAVTKLDTRNDVRRRTRRLAELHELHFEYDAEMNSANLDALFELSNRRWDTKEGKMSGVFAGDRGRRFVAEVGKAMRDVGTARLSLLRADEQVVAARFGFECDGAYLGWKECFDPDFSKFGPGQMLTSRILHHEVDRSMREFDFLRGAGEHKAAWVNAERQVGYWTIQRAGARGRVLRKLMWAQIRLRLRRWAG